MAIVTSAEMFRKAYEGGYAIGAFNVNNMEIIQGITEAAAEVRAPLILQVSAGARKYAKHVYLMKMIEAAVADTDLPIAVHLDHGPDFETCKSCIDGGFSSVMIDKSGLPFEENIKESDYVVENDYFRLTVDCQICDGNFTQGIWTLTALNDEAKEHLEDVIRLQDENRFSVTILSTKADELRNSSPVTHKDKTYYITGDYSTFLKRMIIKQIINELNLNAAVEVV